MVWYTHLARPVIVKDGGVIMGFLDAILHAAAISAIEARREVRQEEQQTRVEFNHCLEVQDSLDDLFRRTGSPACYIANTRNIRPEIFKMKGWMQSYKEYLSLGGDASAIKYVEDIDSELEFIKELSAMGRIAEQGNYRYWRESILALTSPECVCPNTSSKEGFIGILRFSKIDRSGALWLLNKCNIDWDRQAMLRAQELIEIDVVYTKKHLINTLLDDGFTEEQSRKAADACWKDCDIDWNKQALKAAQRYVELCDGTKIKKEVIINKLVNDGFTEDQALKAVMICWRS